MKFILFLSLILCECLGLNAQQYGGYSGNYIPANETNSTNSIAGYVAANYKTDSEKLRVVYNWVTTNIRYDKDSMYNINWATDLSTKAAATLRRRKGVCENYASVFTDILVKCGIPSYVVSGYTNHAGFGKNTGHSWSAVFYNNAWLLCDPTWDIGFGNHTNYFLISPENFIESHTPFDPIWKLIPEPLLNQKSKTGNNIYRSVNDDVQSFLQLDSMQQLEVSSQRMLKATQQNKEQKIWQSYVKMQIAIVHNEEDMNLYNAVVEDLNRANTIFNAFVQFRNNQFSPSKPDMEINSMLNPIYGIITIAKSKLDKIGKVVGNEQYNTESILLKFAALSQRVQEQKDFLKNYFSHTVADRGKLFYK